MLPIQSPTQSNRIRPHEKRESSRESMSMRQNRQEAAGGQEIGGWQRAAPQGSEDGNTSSARSTPRPNPSPVLVWMSAPFCPCPFIGCVPLGTRCVIDCTPWTMNHASATSVTPAPPCSMGAVSTDDTSLRLRRASWMASRSAPVPLPCKISTVSRPAAMASSINRSTR